MHTRSRKIEDYYDENAGWAHHWELPFVRFCRKNEPSFREGLSFLLLKIEDDYLCCCLIDCTNANETRSFKSSQTTKKEEKKEKIQQTQSSTMTTDFDEWCLADPVSLALSSSEFAHTHFFFPFRSCSDSCV